MTGATTQAATTGATGSGETGGSSSGATGGGLTTPITQSNLLSSDPYASSFLSPAGSTTIVLAGKAQTALIQAGTDFVQNFNAGQGDKLDLTNLLAGAPLAPDLANIGDFVRVLGHDQNDPGFGPGTKTSLEVSGPGGSAIVNLEGSGKVELKDLLTHNSLILPPH